MKVLTTAAALAGLTVCLAGPAFSAENNTLFGMWIDPLPGGNSMVIEFTPERISFQGMTPDGSMAPPSTFPATYEKQKGDGQFIVAIEGQPNDPLAVSVEGADKLTLKFPGRDPRELKRYTPQAAARPPGHP